ncbi:MAG TPA: SDR family NAD(P)-dependent oxidoreductase [Terriglobales bacterium]|nr:SDR family NAD(P)-dependent oxidoreductase [Terriglobales bacterium]
MTTIRFTTADLDLFQAASHDRNPLHTSQEYARRTAYGDRVVYGVLNAAMALGRGAVLDRPGWVISSIECDFFDVASLGVDYSVSVNERAPSEVTLRVSDGRRPVLETILTFRPGVRRNLRQSRDNLSLRSNPQDFQIADFTVGQRISGKYGVCQDQVEALCACAGLNASWTTAPELSALLWASYLIGMELPGKRALFSRLLIEFQPDIPVGAPFQYQAEIEGISEVGELSVSAELSSEDHIWAKARINAYVRQDVPAADTKTIENLVGRSESLVGKTALVTGASRGLGAAIVRALTLHGCTVIMNFLNSDSDAQQVRDSLRQASGKVLFEKGDVADVPWCVDLQHRVATNLKRLDFLICNASPPLLPLWLEPSAAMRVNEFLAKSIAMVAAPTASLMPLVAEAKGWNILISSTAVTQIHPCYPHYAAAKAAAEAITRAAVAEYRTVNGLIVRPARLLTDLTNTPLGRKGALPSQAVAASLVHRLLKPPCPGRIEVLDQFSSP